MADKAISELVEASQITATDMFVLEQDNSAKKLTGQVLLNWLTKAADGHGGIQNVEQVSSNGLADTYRITLADLTTFDFVVTNGRAIAAITQSSVDGLTRTYTIAFNDNTVETFQVTDGRSITSFKLTSTVGLVDTYTITYNDGTTDTLSVANGAKGDKGDNSYIWIKYASQEPTETSNSIGDLPDDWMGIYSGNADTAPDDWTQYRWYRIKGEKGDAGEPATLSSGVTEYQVSDSGNIIPSGEWSTSIPVVAQGRYLWTRTTITFNTGSPIVSYSVSRFGIDGAGSVSSVAGISPDAGGNVALSAVDVGALPLAGGDMEGPINMHGQSLSGLNAPTEEDEAANKGYVDTAKTEAKTEAQAYTDQQITDRVIYSGGKNLLKNTAKNRTFASTAFTVNDDGSVYVVSDGTQTDYPAISCDVKLSPGRYIYSDNHGAGLSFIRIYNNSIAEFVGDYRNNETFEVIETNIVAFRVQVSPGVTVAGATLYPMIRLASDTDDTYEPYYKGLFALNHSVYKGSRNLLKNTAKSQTVSGVTFTVNADGSVTANGTATGYAFVQFAIPTLPANKYILSGGTQALNIYVRNSDAIVAGSAGSEGVFEVADNTQLFVRYVTGEGNVLNNEVIYPMIRLASDTDDTYEPYYVGLPDVTPENIGALSTELLWENASAGSEFGVQTVKLDLSEYKSVKIVLNYATTLQWNIEFTIDVNRTGVAYMSMARNVYRQITVGTAGVAFEKGQRYDTYAGTAIEDNVYLIPCEIYGIKGVSA